MKLSEYFDNTLRDAEFDSVGILRSQPGNKLLTYAENSKFLSAALRNSSVSAIICTPEIAANIPEQYGVIVSETPRYELFRLHNCLCESKSYIRKKFKSIIPGSCHIHPTAVISEYNVTLGENVVIEELVSIKDNVRIGNNCTIRSGCVIGATDFEVKRFIDCTFVVSHAGSVCIGDNVEIQSNCFVGKAVFPWDFTIIGDYTVLGSYVDVGHCGVIGKRVLIANGTVLSGSCNIGDDVWIGPKSLVNNWVHIGNNARVSLGSVVLRDVPSGQTVSGNPAVEHQLYLQNYLDVLRKGSELQFEKSTST